jgi:hypothetical protein
VLATERGKCHNMFGCSLLGPSRETKQNTLTFLYIPASRRRRRNGIQCLGVITGSHFSWGIQIRGLSPPGEGSLETDTVKNGHESRWTRAPEYLRWRGPEAVVNDRPVISSERTPHIYKRANDSNKNLFLGPQMGAWPQDRLTDWPSVAT